VSGDFYDKIAVKLGGYGYGNDHKPTYKSEYPNGDPEKIFKDKLLKLSSENKIVLDIGCADGKFTLSIAPFFQKIYGIDTSKVNLDIAKSHGEDERSKNVEYSFQNACHTTFKNSFFDIAYNRRGPVYYEEYFRVLKTNGMYLEIDIGEADAKELKIIFNRGQGYGKWNISVLDEKLNKLNKLGFNTIFAVNCHYFEYYPSYKQFDLFLQGVPIFEDYDSDKDKMTLQKYIRSYSSNKGIMLSRHRTVIVAQT
jgi:SAM-dependent methyltransferase